MQRMCVTPPYFCDFPTDVGKNTVPKEELPSWKPPGSRFSLPSQGYILAWIDVHVF